MNRQKALENWLDNVLEGQAYSLATASADASFRRYFRIVTGSQSLIAMDAPPPQEDCRPFVHAAEVLLNAGLNVPRVIAMDIAQGFLLLSDLGDTTYLGVLNDENAGQLYHDACQALIRLQLASREGVFPLYDEALLTREMQLFPDWYIARHLGATLDDAQRTVLSDIFALLNRNILGQAQVYVHRDYHSRNLMVGLSPTTWFRY